MDDVTFEAPGKGPWELETTHFQRPATRFAGSTYVEAFGRGFAQGTERYGMLLSHLQPGLSNGFLYMQPVAFMAPEGAMKPPPAPVLWLLTRVHPKMRARIKQSARAMENKQWRADLEMWDNEDKPAAIEKHLEIQNVDVEALTDEGLIEHLERCRAHGVEMVALHHKYTATAVVVTGDFLADVSEWTGQPFGAIAALLRGSSPISNGFAADELIKAGGAIAGSEQARSVLNTPGDPEQTIRALSDDPDVGPAIRAYVDAVQYRSVGYDVGDANAGEMPELLVGALRAAVDPQPRADSSGGLDELRAKVPPELQATFDEKLAEARLVNRIRDERGVYADGWATGLARRALLEAGRRLQSRGLLHAAEHAPDLTLEELSSLLRGAGGPTADEAVEHHEWRTTKTFADAPPFLNAMPAPPPPTSLLPAAAQRVARAMDAALFNLFGVSEEENTDTVLHGLSVSEGVYEGTARLVDKSSDFGRIKQGDVLVTRNTSPYFNVVLPLLGAIVTDRGGQLSHAAIVAREYGIPGVVGTRDATSVIPDGARVRVDGTTGEVHVLTTP
jgi:phosphohistidine swiveling domain-containing protein